jgi:hypothetical protein
MLKDNTDPEYLFLKTLNEQQQEIIETQKKTIELLKKQINQYKNAMLQGAIFKYKNGEKVFIPIFFIPDRNMLIVDEDYPIDFELNFDDDTIADWLKACNNIVKKDTE